MQEENHFLRTQQRLEKLEADIKICQEEIAMLRQGALIPTDREVKILVPKQQPYLNKPKTFENVIGLNVLHVVGIIVLIIGLSIAVKYAIDANLISATLRIVLTYVAGVALFLLSLQLRKKYILFSVMLFSGAMASLYFTTYAAFAYYQMMPRIIAFTVMLALTMFTVYNALRYNRQQVAILGLVGAYAIPFFVRGTADNLPALFTYIFIINTGILFLAFKKNWLSLRYISFFSTWCIFFVSIWLQYGNPANPLIDVFAIAFFILFLVSNLASALYRKHKIGKTEILLLAGNILFLYFALLNLQNNPDDPDRLTLVFTCVFAVATIFAKRFLQNEKLLGDSLFAIFILGLICYIPMQFQGLTTTIIWGLLAVLLFSVGMWLKESMFRFCAIFLFGVSLLKLLGFDSDRFTSVQKVIAYIFTGVILLIVSFLYQRFKSRIFMDEEGK